MGAVADALMRLRARPGDVILRPGECLVVQPAEPVEGWWTRLCDDASPAERAAELRAMWGPA